MCACKREREEVKKRSERWDVGTEWSGDSGQPDRGETSVKSAEKRMNTPKTSESWAAGRTKFSQTTSTCSPHHQLTPLRVSTASTLGL